MATAETEIMSWNISALRAYACQSYWYINRLLREQEAPEMDDYEQRNHDEWIRNLIWRLADIPPTFLTEPMTCYRAMVPFADDWHELGFLSTSRTILFPKHYARMTQIGPKAPPKEKQRKLYRVELAEGVPVVFLTDILKKYNDDRTESEDEILVWPGCDCRVAGTTIFVTPTETAGQILIPENAWRTFKPRREIVWPAG